MRPEAKEASGEGCEAEVESPARRSQRPEAQRHRMKPPAGFPRAPEFRDARKKSLRRPLMFALLAAGADRRRIFLCDRRRGYVHG